MNFDGRDALTMSEILAMTRLLPERHAQMGEEGLGLLVRPGSGHDVDVHAAHLVDLVVDDFRENELLAQAQGVVPPPVEPPRRHAAEVAHAGQGHAHQAVEELVHPRPAEGDLGADRHTLAQLEVGDRLLGARHQGPLSGDGLEIRGGEIESLGVLAPLAHPHAHHDLVQARHLPGVLVPPFLHEGRTHALAKAHQEARRDFPGPLGANGRHGRRRRGLASARRSLGSWRLGFRSWGACLCHCRYPLSTDSPQRLHTRTLRPSASIRMPVRTGRSQRAHTTRTLETASGPSRSMMPPWRNFGVGRWCRLIMFRCSTITRSDSRITRSTLPRLPRSLPAITPTVSPRRT